MSRMTDLLTAAAEALEDARDPFHHEFLVEHNVTSTECLDLSDLLAAGARLIVLGLENPKIAAGAVHGASTAAAYQALNAALAKLPPASGV